MERRSPHRLGGIQNWPPNNWSTSSPRTGVVIVAIALLAVAFGGPRLLAPAGSHAASGAATAAGGAHKSAVAVQISRALDRTYVPHTPWSARAATILKSLPCLVPPSRLKAMVSYAEAQGSGGGAPSPAQAGQICRRFGSRSGGG